MSREAAGYKAPDAFRTISEAAEELDLPQHVLRFWESRFPHIKPLKRGGGRRYYRPEDVDLLRGIRRLLYSDGYTIKGVQRILREQGVRTVQLVGQGQALTSGGEPGDEMGEEPVAEPIDDDVLVNGALLTNGQAPPIPQLEWRPNGVTQGDASADMNAVMTAAATRQREEVPPPPPCYVPQAHRQTGANGSFDHPLVGNGGAPAEAVAASAPAVLAPPPSAAGRVGMAAEDLERLRRALGQLEACRRLLNEVFDGRGDHPD